MSRPLVAPGTRRVGLTRTAPSTAVIGVAVLVCGGGSAFAQEAPPTEPVPDAAPVSPPPEPEISDRPDNDPEPPRMARTRPPPRDEVYVVEPNAPPPPPCATCGAEDDPYPDLEAG